jgi:hypothetical protein
MVVPWEDSILAMEGARRVANTLMDIIIIIIIRDMALDREVGDWMMARTAIK